jgi:hypothetical protein
MQRDFTYVTQDIRNGYAVLKDALSNPQYKKIVFIIHSQGGIEGGLIIDWLCAEVSRELMEKLEVYTFGNAANHFNNPVSIMQSEAESNSASEEIAVVPSSSRTIKHIEHYANDGDFVSRWGVLHFASGGNMQGRNNRYSGRVFERHGKGHQFNQHYLDTMFPLDQSPNGHGVSKENPFMDSEVQIAESPKSQDLQLVAPENGGKDALAVTEKVANDDSEPKVKVRNLTFPPQRASFSLLSSTTRPSAQKVAYYSRLWQYRNGMSPPK